MKRLIQFSFICLFAIPVVFVGCTMEKDPQSDLLDAEAVLFSYFDGIMNLDYQKMREACSSDFLLFEDGIIWTVEDHISYLEAMEGKGSISYSFADVKKNIEGSVAWITHRNIAEAAIEGNSMQFEWIESAVLRKIDGNWKMVLLHSTSAKPSDMQ